MKKTSLLLMVLFGVCFTLFNLALAEETSTNINYATNTSSISEPTAENNIQVPQKKIIVYYFHTNFRCANCFKLEKYSHEAVQQGFKQQLEDGSLVWKVINVDKAENKHFVQDYQLFTKSLVIVEKQGDKQLRWKNLQKVWEYLGNKQKFLQYVQDEVHAYLEGK